MLPFVTTVEHTVLFPHFELNGLLYRTVQLKEYVLFVTVVRQEMNFTICLTVPTKMSRETVLSMLINIIHIIPTRPDFVVS